MAATLPTTGETLLALIRRSGVTDPKRLDAVLERRRAAGERLDDPNALATALVNDGVLTYFQSEQLLQGRHRGFTMGQYRLLERLGSGGMGSVFLAEHLSTKARVALKVLPRDIADKPTIAERFQREARAAAALNHPNVVRAHALEKDGDLRFLVMEYVEGQDFRWLVKQHGAVDPIRAAHYIRQAAKGLQHVHNAGLIHRDMKPANVLLDRAGTVKLLDLGLARFIDDTDELTRQQGDGIILGTADYLSPEQAVDSHEVDTRTDIYSLGATFYYLLTGQSPVPDAPVPRKLIFIQTKPPTPIRTLRPEVPAELVAVVDKMMAKAPDQRMQTPRDVVKALERFTRTPIPPPTEEPNVRLSPLARGTSALPGKVVTGATKAVPKSPAPGISRQTAATSGNSSSDTFPNRRSNTTTLSSPSTPRVPPEQNAFSWSRLPLPWLIGGAFAGGGVFALVVILLWRLLFS